MKFPNRFAIMALFLSVKPGPQLPDVCPDAGSTSEELFVSVS